MRISNYVPGSILAWERKKRDEMSRKLVPFPLHPIDPPVKAWLEQHDIDPNIVRSFCIERGADGQTLLSVEVYFDPPKTWTQEDLDKIREKAHADAEEFQKYID